MVMIHRSSRLARETGALPLVAILLTLSACDGDNGAVASSAVAQQAPSGAAQSFALSVPTQDPSLELSATQAQPQFHVAPLVLDEPADRDMADPAASAGSGPHIQTVSPELAQLSSRRLTRAAIDSVLQDGIVPSEFAADAPGATPLASGTVVATYTPAQIRAAYGLPSLPAAGTTLTSVQASHLGAGQTIYLVDAQDDPNAAAELATFNQQFGLPSCSVSSISTSAALPLTPAGTSGCSFSVVHSTVSGGMTSSAPAYNSGWATEIALDVQWAHATAPLARIILIEAPDASTSSLLAAVSLANAMGPGVVSMSFGATEGSWTASVDSSFQGAAMTYVAAAGDSGTGVIWPSASSHVLAVGGSTLTYTGTLPRSEIVWSGTGGGISQYTPTPAYQSSAVPDMGTPAHRSVSDVTFNADPYSGQYVAVLTPGATTVSWLDVGGTSLATPQWAGIIAVANALRGQAAQAPLGDPHAKIYAVATQSATYASAFYDVIHGADGSCALCFAQVGYDPPSGIGTPNVTSLLSALVAAPAPTAPVVAAASISGTAGTPLSFTAAVTASDPVTYSLGNAPAGMSINASGLVSWPAPVTGTFALSLSARDTVSGLSGQGVYTVTIQAAKPPVVASTSLTGTAGAALTYPVSVTDVNPVTFTLSGAPSGMVISAAGVLSWPSPVTGTASVNVTAHDARSGLSGQGQLVITITPPKAPSVTAANVSATVGKALSFTVSVTAADAVTFSLAGAPAGMAVSSTGVITWASPLAGTYAVTVSAKDTKTALTGSAVCTVTVTSAGPVITAGAMTGTAGTVLTGVISFSDATSNSMSISIAGVPMGMTITPSGPSLNLRWATPVTGSYSLSVNAKDGNGLTASLSIPITIKAH